MYHPNTDRPPVRSSPRRTRAPKDLLPSALRWATHCRDHGCRFDAQRKAAEAIAFTLGVGGTSFALPSKLEGVARPPRQHHLALIRERLHDGQRWQSLHLFEADDGQRPAIVALHEGAILGHIRPKHVRWLAPLLPFGHVRAYVLAITGGPERGVDHFGCNIVLAGLPAALRDYDEALHAADFGMISGDGAPPAEPTPMPANGLPDGEGEWDIEALIPPAAIDPEDFFEPCSDDLAR